MIPKDPVMLLSYVNTQLRDFYSSLSSMCEDKGLNPEEIKTKLAGIDYEYDRARNQFKLVEDMEKKLKLFNRIVADTARDLSIGGGK